MDYEKKLSDSEYIKELEALVCFLASSYNACKEVYMDSHLETCSVSNPNRRSLTESEQNEINKFPLIQGTPNIMAIEKLAKAKKKITIPLTRLTEKILSHEDIITDEDRRETFKKVFGNCKHDKGYVTNTSGSGSKCIMCGKEMF